MLGYSDADAIVSLQHHGDKHGHTRAQQLINGDMLAKNTLTPGASLTTRKHNYAISGIRSHQPY